MTPKENVLQKFPEAYSAQDVDGFWWIWTPKIRGALNDARYQTKSASMAWYYASHNALMEI